mmetsp:Transcript_81284/g.226314  ORF Transcript_81284/g.226314 Transcript_81284/m.226314 type:complete len:225 (-) Transcript_81284:214-888(-)
MAHVAARRAAAPARRGGPGTLDGVQVMAQRPPVALYILDFILRLAQRARQRSTVGFELGDRKPRLRQPRPTLFQDLLDPGHYQVLLNCRCRQVRALGWAMSGTTHGRRRISPRGGSRPDRTAAQFRVVARWLLEATSRKRQWRCRSHGRGRGRGQCRSKLFDMHRRLGPRSPAHPTIQRICRERVPTCAGLREDLRRAREQHPLWGRLWRHDLTSSGASRLCSR